ncbi:MAG: penicillin-binding protein 2 [Thioalkalivibrionaceae bacterium]
MRRGLFAVGVVFLAFAVIGWRVHGLQVEGYEHFRTLSENNRLRVEPIAPTRGLIYDRNGVLLAENRPSYQVEVTVEQVRDLDALFDTLAPLIDLTATDRDRFRASLRGRRPFQPILLKSGLDDVAVARVAVRRHEMPGVDVVARPTRHYPMGADLAHVVGYVGRISESDLTRIDRSNYAASTHTGKTGIERFYEDRLHGRVGHRQVEVNAQGRVIRELAARPPERGQDLVLTIDSHLQRKVRELFEGYNGAAVVADVRSGEVLAMVSKPGFDPNWFVNGISHARYAQLQNDPARPLFNRLLSGQYPPGSTLKPVMGLIALDSGHTTAERRMFATGYFQIPGHERRYRDWRRSGHGWVDLSRAIAVSSDVYFYELAYRMGIDTLSKGLMDWGLGAPTLIDLPGERRGILPSREWKRATMNQAWFPGETLITVIGQGYMLTTPVQLADVTVTLANRGDRKRLHLLRELRGETYGDPVPIRVDPPPVDYPAAAWRVIHQALDDAVHARHGTAHGSVGRTTPAVRMAGKTGTAQVFGLGEDEKYDETRLDRRLWDHALFIGYAPADDPEIAVVVVVEHGGSGGRVAAPLAQRIVDAFYAPADAPVDEDSAVYESRLRPFSPDGESAAVRGEHVSWR